MEISRAVLSDAADIAALHHAGLLAVYDAVPQVAAKLDFDSLSGTSAQRWQMWICRKHAYTFVAKTRGRVIAFSAGHPRQAESVSAHELSMLSVSPGMWRKGIGRALCEASLIESKRRGADTVMLWVFERNDRARRFYEALGFVADGAERIFVQAAGQAFLDIRMRRATGDVCATQSGVRR